MRTRFLLLAGLLVSLSGCQKVPPPFTEAGGVVTINGKPLPNAEIEFYPEVEGFGIQLNSTGTTDEEGRFALTSTYKNQNGAAVCTHRVVVRDPPLPAALRGDSNQDKASRYLAKMQNRPIPEKYNTMAATPLRVEVKADQKEYKIELTRDK
jgi:hypothetical protein